MTHGHGPCLVDESCCALVDAVVSLAPPLGGPGVVAQLEPVVALDANGDPWVAWVETVLEEEDENGRASLVRWGRWRRSDGAFEQVGQHEGLSEWLSMVSHGEGVDIAWQAPVMEGVVRTASTRTPRRVYGA
ncbi:MAG: hypothetical protein AAFS10_19005 [Myxococcota bacterium]